MKTFRLTWPGGELSLEKPSVMGVLNLTPDSFSDGGTFVEPARAVEHAWRMKEEGADLIDVGAESTRPGAQDIDEVTERSRLWPILVKLKEENFSLPISLDTSKPTIAQEALEQGLVQIINDVEGLRNPKMVDVVRNNRVPVILMHMFGKPRTMQDDYQYDDVVRDLIQFFRGRLAEANLTENVVLDPGIGFGKSVEQNLAIIHRLREFESLECPLLIGASRKSFLGKILDAKVGDRLEGSLAAATLALYNGASMVRVHDVRPTVAALRLVEAIRKG